MKSRLSSLSLSVRYEPWNEKKRWEYTKCRKHEIPKPLNFQPTYGNFTTGLHYARICGYRSTQPHRFVQDAADCLMDFLDNNREEARWAYYTGNSFKDSGFFDLAVPMDKTAIQLNRYHDDSYQACVNMIRYYMMYYIHANTK